MILTKVIADFFSSLVFSFNNMRLEVSSTLPNVDWNEGHQAVSSGIAEMTIYFQNELKGMLMEFEKQRNAAVETVNGI